MKEESRKLINAITKGEKFLIYDTETSGIKKTDVIVEFSAIVLAKEDGKYKLIDKLEQYIRPKFQMSDEVISIHGITNEFLVDYPYEEEAYPIIKAFFEKHKDAVITGYNQVSFDDRMLYNLALRQNDFVPEHFEKELDVYKVVKENIFEGKRKLSEIHAKLCPTVKDIGFHNSSDDIRATWNVLVALYKQIINEKPVEQISVTPIKAHKYSPGRGRNYLFVTVVDKDGCFSKIYYDFYYEAWKSKELNIKSINTDLIEDKLNKCFGSLKEAEGKVR